MAADITNDVVAYDYCAFVLLLIIVVYYFRTSVHGTYRVRIMTLIVSATMAAAACDATRVRFAGLGVVSDLQGRNVVFHFPLVNQTRIYRMDNAPVERFVLNPGETAKSEKGASFVIESLRESSGVVVYVGRGGKEIKESDLVAKQGARVVDLFKALSNIGSEGFYGNSGQGDVSSKAFDRRSRALALSCKWQSSPVRGIIISAIEPVLALRSRGLCFRTRLALERPSKRV